MSETITITKSIDVDIEYVSDTRAEARSEGATVATVPATDYTEAREVARAAIYLSDARPDGTTRFTVSGCFVDNYAVEARARSYAAGLTVDFDSESGQFFAYVRSFDAALLLARIVVKAAVEVALERGEL